jgi:hypothetical protein
MKKRRIKNPVAKHMGTFCHAATYKDKTKYCKKTKHKGQKDPYLLSVLST